MQVEILLKEMVETSITTYFAKVSGDVLGDQEESLLSSSGPTRRELPCALASLMDWMIRAVLPSQSKTHWFREHVERVILDGQGLELAKMK